MKRLRCRPIVHLTVNRPHAAYEHHGNLARKEKEWKRKGDGKREGRLKRSLSGAKWAKPPHELQPVREKLTESVAQLCSILCTTNHNFKISTSECIRYPPKCVFSRVSNEKFSGEGAQPPSPDPTPGPTRRRLRKLVPPLFGTKLRP